MPHPIIVRRRKARGANDKRPPHGSWKVAYADFLTAMMAFFMVMWIMGLSDETRAIVAGYFNDPRGFMKDEPRSASAVEMPGMKSHRPGQDLRNGTSPVEDVKNMRKLRSQLEHEMQKAAKSAPHLAPMIENIEISITREGMQIEFVESGSSAFFETGSSRLLPSAFELVKRIAPSLAREKHKIAVEGHTDAAPYPGENYTNWDLSADRASAFRRALAGAGVPESQFQSVTGFADTRLRYPRDPLHFSNRRVSLLLPFGANPLPEAASRRYPEPKVVAPEPVRLGSRR